MYFVELMLLALLLELALGWPARLFFVIKHPVVWMGSLINYLEHRLNRTTSSNPQRYLGGMTTTLVVVGVSMAIAFGISHWLPNAPIGLLVEALVASSLLASRSLYQHVNAVAVPLLNADIISARMSLSQIVGRDTEQLDESGIASAAIESLAENASDGVFAPLFWGLLLGLPGIAGYKAINTLDSMIGHRTAQYLSFGRFAAKLDDLINLIPARISAVLLMLVAANFLTFTAIVGDAKKHRSPNAGWPEGAMARALHIRLSGPRTYSDSVSDEDWINEDGAVPKAIDIKRALSIYSKSIGLTLVLMALSIIAIHSI